jgi:hypothetical protein
MQLVSASAAELRFGGRTRLLASGLLAPLSLALASLPWVAEAPVDPVRALVSCFFLGAAGVAVFTSWPRRLLVEIACGERQLSVGSQKSALSGQLRWVLCAEEQADGPHTAYVARLQLEDGSGWALIRDRHPARVLEQLRQLQACWPQPVESRWGLPEQLRPWEPEPREPEPREPETAAEGPPAQALIRVPMAHKDLRWSIALMTLLVLVYLTFLVATAGAEVAHIHPLSVVLPIVLGASMLVLSLALATWHARLVVAQRVSVETSWFGVRRVDASVSRRSLRGVYVLGAAGSERWHLLLDSSEGALALPVPRSQAEALARQARSALSMARD